MTLRSGRSSTTFKMAMAALLILIIWAWFDAGSALFLGVVLLYSVFVLVFNYQLGRSGHRKEDLTRKERFALSLMTLAPWLIWIANHGRGTR